MAPSPRELSPKVTEGVIPVTQKDGRNGFFAVAQNDKRETWYRAGGRRPPLPRKVPCRDNLARRVVAPHTKRTAPRPVILRP